MSEDNSNKEQVTPVAEEIAPVAEDVSPSGEGTLDPTFGVTPVAEEIVFPPATEEIKFFYNGQDITERLGKFDADGAEECKLADGTTTFVPKSVFGE